MVHEAGSAMGAQRLALPSADEARDRGAAETAPSAKRRRAAGLRGAMLLGTFLLAAAPAMAAEQRAADATDGTLAPALPMMDGTAVALDRQLAQAAPAPAQPATPAAPAAWADTLAIGGHLEAGISGNPDAAANRRSLGHLFDDHTNVPVVNQLWGYIQRPLDPKATDWDFGFVVDGLFGTDARYLHVFDQFDHPDNSSYQPALVEAYGLAHAPGIGAGGMDIKFGQFASPMSAETIDPTNNTFYSHSYIFNFGVPLQHTGIFTTTHATSILDLYFGLDTGVNAWLGDSRFGLNNDTVIHGQAGFALTLLGGNLTLTALTHIGPENPKRVFGSAANSALRYLNDAVLVWKASDKLTLTTDVNYIRDDLVNATGYGFAQYVAYTIDDIFTFVARGEVWRDNSGFFVASFQQPYDFINAERGLPTSPGGVIGGGATTYGAITVGVNIKPPVPKQIAGFVIRPEIRFDDALNGTKPFIGGTQGHQVTLAADFILPFSF